MYEHQIHIIKEFISTALICDDPEKALLDAFLKTIDIADDGEVLEFALTEYLYQAEKTLPLNNLTK